MTYFLMNSKYPSRKPMIKGRNIIDDIYLYFASNIIINFDINGLLCMNKGMIRIGNQKFKKSGAIF